MGKGRLEAFSDGVLAIIITIMVLELKVPHGASLNDLKPLLPVFLSYVLSFVYVGIYWGNHHHLVHLLKHVDGRVIWANLHLLFWLSLVPFVTNWMGDHPLATMPTLMYGFVLFMAGLGYDWLVRAIRHANHETNLLGHAARKSHKGTISLVAYALAMLVAPPAPWLSVLLYAAVAVMWFLPDRRIEHTLQSPG